MTSRSARKTASKATARCATTAPSTRLRAPTSEQSILEATRRHRQRPLRGWSGIDARADPPQLPALLALRPAPDLPRRDQSWFVRVTASKDRERLVDTNQRDQLGARSTSATAASATGSRTHATGRSRAIASGARRSRCGAATAARTSRCIGSVTRPRDSEPAAPVTDLHRPTIDEVTCSLRRCGGSCVRVPDVLDCWFESGSMPYAQLHYPFERAGGVRGDVPGRLHRRVRRADPRLVLHAGRRCRRRCSTASRSTTPCATA